MKKSNYVTILFLCLFTFGGLFVFINEPTISTVLAVNPTPTPSPASAGNFYATTKDMPDEFMYSMLFLQITSLEEKDSESFAAGETTKFKEAYYENTLGLQASQFAALDTVKNNAISQLAPIAQSARDIVEAYRAEYPGGELKTVQSTPTPQKFGALRSPRLTEPLPPVPAGLAQLQIQKNQVILNAKNSLAQSLGQTNFAAFDARLRKHYKNVMVPLNLRSRTPQPYPSPSN